MRRDILLIGTRDPTPGLTKTRLGAAIGMDRAAALHAAFLRDLAARFACSADASREFDVGWCYTPADVDFSEVLEGIGCCVASEGVRYVPQNGDSWDIRQANALRWAHCQGYERAILVGSDSPQIACKTVLDAFAALRQHEIVLGRTFDGGYYLIGMRGFHDVLTGVPMSTASVSDVVVAIAAEQRLRVAEVAETFDVDEEPDLRRLCDALQPDDAAAPATWLALRQLGLA